LYVVADDGDYVKYGKEIEVYANHDEAVAMLRFIFDKGEVGVPVHVLRFGMKEYYEPLCRNDRSQEYLEYAREELKSALDLFLEKVRGMNLVESVEACPVVLKYTSVVVTMKREDWEGEEKIYEAYGELLEADPNDVQLRLLVEG